MKLPRNYAEVAERLHVERCQHVHIDGGTYDHQVGQVDERGVIHWRNRLLRRRDLWRFLLLVAWARHEEFDESMPRWKRIYLQSIYAYEAGRELGLVFTRKEMLLRKMRTSNALRGVLIAVDDRPLARKAADWARRR